MNFIKRSGMYLAGRIVPSVIGLGGVALYTRLLDPVPIGEYALLLSVTFLVSATAYTWLRISALRFIAGSAEDELPNLLATILMAFLVTSIVVGPFIAAALHIYKPAFPVSTLALAAAAVIASAWYDLNSSLLQARLSVQSWSILTFCRAVCGVGFSTLLIFMGLKTNALLAGFVIANCTALLFVTIWVPAGRGSFDWSICRRYFRFGWPQSVGAAQEYAASVGERSIVDTGVGAAGLGIFAVAYNFGSLALSSVIGAVSLAGIPLAFRAKDRGDSAALTAQLEANAQLSFAVGLPAMAGLCVLAEPISHFVFGPKFWDGASLILAIVAVMSFADNIRAFYFDQAFELSLQMRPQAIISLVRTVLAVGGCLLLVPRYGAMGAAISALVASFVSLGLSVWWGPRMLAMPIPIRDWLKTVFATGCMGLTLVVIPKTSSVIVLASEVLGGCALYIAVSVAVRPALIRTYVRHRFVTVGS
jgi:O-antigen/teichoic acid export membrane protein